MAQTNDEIIKRIMERYVETPIHSVNLHTRLNWIINQARLAALDDCKTFLQESFIKELDKIVEEPDGFPKAEEHKDGADYYISIRKYSAFKAKALAELEALKTSF